MASRRQVLCSLGAARVGGAAGCAGAGIPGLGPEPWPRRPTPAPNLVPDDGDAGDPFGLAVTLSRDGTTAVVGVGGDEDPNGEEAGVAHVFER